ncbi:MAG: hypothetical protein QM790_07240 [Nibricoccus sp.]
MNTALQNPPGTKTDERPIARVTKNITDVVIWTLPATPERIFPLLCPVREYDWIPWWRAELIHSKSGFAEENCIFRTHVGPPAGLTWVCTRFEPNQAIDYTCFAPDKLIVRLKILLVPIANTTQIVWTRDWLSLGAAGDAVIEQWSATEYRAIMAQHEKDMEHYLRTGRLPA